MNFTLIGRALIVFPIFFYPFTGGFMAAIDNKYISTQNLKTTGFLPDIDSSTTVAEFETARAKNPDYKFTHSHSYGKHALQYAAEEGNAPLVVHILKEGGNGLVDLSDHCGRTALYHVCKQKNREFDACVTVINKLLEHRADINAQTLSKDDPGIPFGSTPLWAAAHKAKSVALAALLLEHGAEVGKAACTDDALIILMQAQEMLKKQSEEQCE